MILLQISYSVSNALFTPFQSSAEIRRCFESLHLSLSSALSKLATGAFSHKHYKHLHKYHCMHFHKHSLALVAHFCHTHTHTRMQISFHWKKHMHALVYLFILARLNLSDTARSCCKTHKCIITCIYTHVRNFRCLTFISFAISIRTARDSHWSCCKTHKCIDTFIYTNVRNFTFSHSQCIDIYSDSARFSLELLQNADDNHYAATLSDEAPFFSLKITPGYVWVRNNELGFSERDVRALCDVCIYTFVA